MKRSDSKAPSEKQKSEPTNDPKKSQKTIKSEILPDTGAQSISPPGKTGRKMKLDDSVDSDEYREKEVEYNPMQCRDHQGNYFSQYCETCEELVCQVCTIYGPHNTSEHWLMSIEEASESRKIKLGFIIHNKLRTERSAAIRAEIMRLNGKRQELHDVKEEIAEETKECCAAMINRLDSCAEPKFARLNAEAKELMQDLDCIEKVIRDCQQSAVEHPAYLLSRVKVFRENISYTLSKPFTKELEETPYDLPRELYDLRKTLEDMDNYENLIRFKNRIIADLAFENLTKQRQMDKAMNYKSDEEVQSWIKLVDKLSSQLANVTMVCHFCSSPLSENNVNLECVVNRPNNKVLSSQFKGFSQGTPEYEYLGCGRHYFAKPNAEILANPELMNIMNNHIYKLSADPQTNPYKAALIHDVEQHLNLIRERVAMYKVDLRPHFEALDKTGLKVLNRVGLLYVFDDVLGIKDSTVDPIITVLDPFRRDMVQYEELLDLITDPTAVERLPFFFYADQSINRGYQAYLTKFEQFRRYEEQKRAEEEKRREEELIRLEKLRQEIDKNRKKDGKGGTGESAGNDEDVQKGGGRYASPQSRARQLTK